MTSTGGTTVESDNTTVGVYLVGDVDRGRVPQPPIPRTAKGKQLSLIRYRRSRVADHKHTRAGERTVTEGGRQKRGAFSNLPRDATGPCDNPPRASQAARARRAAFARRQCCGYHF